MIRVLLALDESVASFCAAREGARRVRADADVVINVVQLRAMGTRGRVRSGVGPAASWDADDLALLSERRPGGASRRGGANPTEALTSLEDPIDASARVNAG